jgi:hypothetical protein
MGMNIRLASATLASVILSSLACAGEQAASATGTPAQAAVKKNAPGHRPITNEAERAEIKAKMLSYTGGTVVQRQESRRLVFLSLQEKVGKDVLSGPSDTIAGFFRIESVLKSRSDGVPPMKAIAEELRDPKAGAVVLVCSDPDHPTLLVAPESRWALINVAALATDKPAADVLAARVQREQWRAFSYLAGMSRANDEKSLHKTVLTPAELDGLNKGPSVETIPNIAAGLPGLGIHPARQTSYRRACEEGWAPAPTNDIQRAIQKEIQAKK